MMSTSTMQVHPGIPRVPSDVISRPRVTALLENGEPLTIVRGACGAGKTVAIAEWAQSTDAIVVWINVDSDTSTSRSLARAVVRNLERQGVTRSDSTTERLSWAGIHEMLSELAEPVAIVLDDAAALRQDAIDDICRLVAATHNARVIAAANRRTALDSEGIEFIVDRTMITPRDLMFDQEEVARALNLDENAAATVLQETGGFSAVIHAAARRGLPKKNGEPFLEAAAEAVHEYMRTRVERARYDPQVMRTLMAVSVADMVDGALAQRLSGHDDAIAVLDEAESYGFGAWSSGKELFTFEPLARLLLRRELLRTQADALPGLRRAAIDWSLGRRDPITALRLAVENDDLAAAGHVIMAGWYHLLEHHGRAVIDVLGSIPLSRLRDEPLVVMILAICYLGSRLRRLRGLQLLRVAISAANSKRSQLSAAERIYIWTAESAALRLIGMHERAGQVATRALKLFADTPESSWEQYAAEMPLVCTQLGVSMYYAGLQRQAVETFTYAAALAAAHDDRKALHSIAMLSGIHALNGDMPEARHYVELVRAGRWDAEVLDGYRGTFYRVGEALLAIEDGDPERALEHVEKFEKHRATSEHWMTMAVVEATVALHTGRPVAAMVHLDSVVRSRGREAQSAEARHTLSRVRSQLHIALGDPRAADAVLQRDGKADSFETLVERARVALVDGRPAEALRILAQSAATPSSSRLDLEAVAIECGALLRTTGISAANRDIERLGSRLSERQLRTPIALLPPQDATALSSLVSGFYPALEGGGSVFPDSAAIPVLTSRERVVLRSLASGAPLAEIAADLRVSQNTVKTQLRSIYRKLGVTGRAEAVELAMTANLLTLGERR